MKSIKVLDNEIKDVTENLIKKIEQLNIDNLNSEFHHSELNFCNTIDENYLKIMMVFDEIKSYARSSVNESNNTVEELVKLDQEIAGGLK